MFEVVGFGSFCFGDIFYVVVSFFIFVRGF